MLTNPMNGKENLYIRVKAKESVNAKTQRLSGEVKTGQLVGNKIIWEDGSVEAWQERKPLRRI